MRLFYVVIILFSLLNSVSGQNISHEPVIYGEDTLEYEDYVETIELEWKIYDDNLKRAEISTQGEVIHVETFQNSSILQNYTVSLSFQLANGVFEFTIHVWDYDNNEALHTTHITKGGTDPTILSLSFGYDFVIFLFLIYLGVSYKRLHNYRDSKIRPSR